MHILLYKKDKKLYTYLSGRVLEDVKGCVRMKFYEIRDPIYGFIKFNELERDIINHPVFQRLRRIRQLGLTDLIYPGAMHTRFEHSLGVMHLATKMYDAIVEKDENKRILSDYLSYNETGLIRDRQIVRLAALLHDIGHSPFSHASEDLFPKNNKTNKRFKHEDYTTTIIKGPLKNVIENHQLNTNYKITVDEITNLIEGIGSIWKILISSQLDADRCDYLLRDSLHIGVKYGVYDVNRLLVTLSLEIDPENPGEPILGITEGGWHIAESLIIARYQMFTQVYYHKTRRAYDFMLKEAIRETINEYPPPNKITDFLQYDDFKLWELMESSNSSWFREIKNRNHIKMLMETKATPTQDEINRFEKIKSILNDKKLWHWEDTAPGAKSWYNDSEEIKIIAEKDGFVRPLSEYSVIVESLKRQFAKSRLYIKPQDKNKVENLIKEV